MTIQKVEKRRIERQRIVRCPALGRLVLVTDETDNRFNCAHCDSCLKITSRSVHCAWTPLISPVIE